MKLLCYWVNPRWHAETDFSIQQATDVIPIEVKAELNLKSKSLRYAYDHFQLRRALRFSMAGYREQDWATSIPLWAAEASAPTWMRTSRMGMMPEPCGQAARRL